MDKSQNNSEASVCSVAKQKMKNKANFNLGKIDVSYYLTSKYENYQVPMVKKTKPILSYCVMRKVCMLAAGTACGF